MDEHTLNDLLECSVCLERLDTTSKVLPCQHTFCRKCLENIVASHNELRCPECRVLIEIKIDDLPPNVLLMRILGGMKNSSQPNQGHQNPETALPSQSVVSLAQFKPSLTNPIQTSSTDPPPTLPTGQGKSPPNVVNYRPNQTQSSSKRIPNSISIPHARALFDFSAKENGDLNFKKGDHIILRKRLDANWLVGEVHGVEGVFPANHVQVVVPLPQPQCKALYDFRMGPNEEEGCLRFKKGSIIHVFRRVDQNWAEGRFGECIGIFPIAFVEMNNLAKQIMDNGGSVAPSTKSSRVAPAIPILSTDSNSSSDSSSTLTNSTCSNSSSSTSSTPTSPSTAPVVIRQSVAGARASNEHKRHSFTVLTNVHHSDPSALSNLLQHSNRHSAEILCSPDPPETAITPQASHSSASGQSENKARVHSRRSLPSASRQESLNNSLAGRASSTRITKFTDLHALPANYVALYPYKPKKSDELELKKGALYNVTERCQDGWFKGTSRSNKCGVFPGNYVALLRNNRDHNKLLNLKRQGNLGTTAAAGSANCQLSQSNGVSSSKTIVAGPKDTASIDSSSSQVPPPELPPRSSAAVPSSSKSVWIKTLGLNVECFFSPKADHSKSDSPGESLNERLKNIKMGQTSTNPAAFSMDNPVFEDCSVGAAGTSGTAMLKRTSQLNHVHVRSGSCPSQLLQTLPQDFKNTPLESQHLKDEFKSNMNRNRPRTGVDCARSRIGDSGLNSPPSVHSHSSSNHSRFVANHNPYASTSHHRKSQSLDATAIASQLSHQAAKYNKTQHHNGPKERFRCIVPYPPNSEYELELQLDDIVFVHKKRENGWYKGSHSRTGKIGLFPASFVQRDDNDKHYVFVSRLGHTYWAYLECLTREL